MQGKNDNNHAEAYWLMYYGCDNCRAVRYIWNSRDGVTPYSTPCLNGCGRLMRHLTIRRANAYPTLPAEATHVWVDLSMERARELAVQFWEAHGRRQAEESDLLKVFTEEELITHRATAFYADGHQPRLITREEYLALR